MSVCVSSYCGGTGCVVCAHMWQKSGAKIRDHYPRISRRERENQRVGKREGEERKEK